MKREYVKINLDEINFSDDYYKISKNMLDESLLNSFKRDGILNPPLLLSDENQKIIVFGHNRLNFIKENGVSSVDVMILKNLNYRLFLNQILLKNYCGEIGILGKIRALEIIREKFPDDFKASSSQILEQLAFPKNILNKDFIKKIKSLDTALKDYIDFKDVNHKIVKKLLSLSDEMIDFLNNSVDKLPFKINIFKQIINIFIDLLKLETKLDLTKLYSFLEMENKKEAEKEIIAYLYEIRYPSFVELKNNADNIVDYFKKLNFEIEYPPYFEGNWVKISKYILKNSNLGEVSSSLNSFDFEKLKELLKIL